MSETDSQVTATPVQVAAPTQAAATPARVIIKPNLKATANKTPYSVALDNMINKFRTSYVNDELTEEQKTQILADIKDTETMVRDLCEEFLRPLCDRPQTGGAAVAASVAATPVVTGTTKALSDWQIFLKYAKDLVPGHKDSTDKMGLCKAHYAGMSEQDRADLRAQYEAQNPGAVAAVAAAAAQTASAAGKAKRQTGFTVFAKDWYAAFKAANPDASGLQSSLCSQAWKELSPAEQQQWKEAAKQQWTVH